MCGWRAVFGTQIQNQSSPGYVSIWLEEKLLFSRLQSKGKVLHENFQL